MLLRGNTGAPPVQRRWDEDSTAHRLSAGIGVSWRKAFLPAGSPRLFYFKDEVNLFDGICLYSIPRKMYNSMRFNHAAAVWLRGGAARHRHDLLARAVKLWLRGTWQPRGEELSMIFRVTSISAEEPGGLLETPQMKPQWPAGRTSSQREGNGISAFSPP